MVSYQLKRQSILFEFHAFSLNSLFLCFLQAWNGNMKISCFFHASRHLFNMKSQYSMTWLNRKTFKPNLLDEPKDISSSEFFFSLFLLFFKPKLSVNRSKMADPLILGLTVLSCILFYYKFQFYLSSSAAKARVERSHLMILILIIKTILFQTIPL